MTFGPIEKRLRECTEGDGATAARAAKLLQALPEPDPLSEPARRRVLGALGASGRSGRGLHLTALQWAMLTLLLVSTAAASAKRVWFPSWLHRRAIAAEKAPDAVPPDPSPAPGPARRTLEAVEAPALPRPSAAPARARASNVKTVVIEEPKFEPLRPRLLSDPQDDSIPRVLPKLVYDSDTYSALLDVCVSSEGRVTKASVVHRQDAALDRAIIEAVERWKYLPGEADGRPVDMCFPLVYRIQVQRD
jgi:TonB family protein